MATRDFLRSELRSQLDEMEERGIRLKEKGRRSGSGDASPGARKGSKPT